MRVLVTGAGGFAGTHLVRLLIEQGHNVIGLVRSSPDLISDRRMIRCDLMHHRRLASIVREFRPERVFHLAGLTRPRLSWRRPRDFYRVNVLGAIHLLVAIREAGLQCRTLAISSGAVYRAVSGRQSLDEDAAVEARDPYSSSKILMEAAALDHFRLYELPVVIARPFNHCGPGQPRGFVVSDFCSQAVRIEQGRQKGPLKTGSLNAVRDFLDVRDVVRSYSELMEKGEAGEVYNICSGEGIRLEALLQIVRRNAKVPLSVKAATASSGEPDIRVGSNEKIRRIAGLESRFSLEQTVAETMEHWRRQAPAF